MTPEEIAAFLQTGQSAITQWALAAEQLVKWSDKFEQTGGTPVYGDDVLQIVTFSNAVQTFLTPEWRAIISKNRNDV